MPTPRKTTKKQSPKTVTGVKTPKSLPDGFYGRNPLAVTLYGPPGVGKTELASHFPGAAFVIDPEEDGISDLVEYNRCPAPLAIIKCDTFKKILDVAKTANIKALKAKGVRSLIYDSLTGLEKLCFQYHCQRYFDGDWSREGFYAFNKGPKNAARTDWPDFIDTLEIIRSEGINVVLVAHSATKPYNNPEGEDHDRYTVYLEKEIWQTVHKWSQSILFYNYEYTINKKKGALKAKADNTNYSRSIHANWSPAYEAKNRYGIDFSIPAGESGEEAFNNLKAAILK